MNFVCFKFHRGCHHGNLPLCWQNGRVLPKNILPRSLAQPLVLTTVPICMEETADPTMTAPTAVLLETAGP